MWIFLCVLCCCWWVFIVRRWVIGIVRLLYITLWILSKFQVYVFTCWALPPVLTYWMHKNNNNNACNVAHKNILPICGSWLPYWWVNVICWFVFVIYSENWMTHNCTINMNVYDIIIQSNRWCNIIPSLGHHHQMNEVELMNQTVMKLTNVSFVLVLAIVVGLLKMLQWKICLLITRYVIDMKKS